MSFRGVLPAITTPFTAAGEVDLAFLERHARWMIAHGCDGIVALGSLGEGAALEPEERRAILATVVRASAPAPVVAAVAGCSTRAAVGAAKAAAEAGCRGLMVLPPWVYRGSEHENVAHVASVLDATSLPCMLYNNPKAYGADFLPGQIATLAARHGNLRAVKDSTGDSRRVRAIRASCGDRLEVLVGLDDALRAGIAAGAVGWIAGLANALPAESVRMHALLQARDPGAAALHRWFLPLLRLDSRPDFVQCIKLVQQEAGIGSERVRPPRLPLVGPARERILRLVRARLRERPAGESAGGPPPV